MSDYLETVRQKIEQQSAPIDEKFVGTPAEHYRHYKLSLPIPSHHKRAKTINETVFSVALFSADSFDSGTYYLIDEGLKTILTASDLPDNAHYVETKEGTLKEIGWLEKFIVDEVPPDTRTVVGIGGGILLNAAAFIAERGGADFISSPTTVLAAADSAIGGLVRINKVDGSQVQKNYYKSVYEPSRIVVDPRALASLPNKQLRFGLSEVIKHGVYQSQALLEYLAGKDFNPLSNQDELLKAICWTVALKNIAMINDPDSESAGGDILRGGHRLALDIEERSNFRVSHGEAVSVGVYQDVLGDPVTVSLLDIIYEKLDLPKTESNLAWSNS